MGQIMWTRKLLGSNHVHMGVAGSGDQSMWTRESLGVK